ncbi:hypothetical protein HF086_008508 [Spodoptera exigua]|uniref:Uncharacterized protein n=1 Tax=Spodoptera exigua TaxID=7107 RepID=A0A922M9R3_SPOEX|nr:hypothetical protein HF086_008508 [Spodoptera exigua]
MNYLKLILLVIYVNIACARRIERSRNETSYRDSSDASSIGKSACHYSDPNVAECIQRIAEQARQLLAQGVPSLNIQPLEPLKIPSISVYPEELKVTANISLPHLMMSGDYVVLGDFQMLPVESTGKMAANFTQCTAALEALGARVHKRMVIRDASVHLKCTGPLKASLMEAHSTTGEMAQMHSMDIAKEVQPAVETALAMVLEDVANKFLKHIPPDMVFAN